VVELFEARRPKDPATISEVDGVVARIEVPGVKWVIIHSDQVVDAEHPEKLYGEVAAEDIHAKDGTLIASAGQELSPNVLAALITSRIRGVKIERRHLVPYRGVLPVREGDQVRAGDALTEGPLDPQKVLQMQGVRAVQEYLVREIQSVYTSHGVSINDKHIEVIVRQMLRKRRVLGRVVRNAARQIYNRFASKCPRYPARAVRKRRGMGASASPRPPSPRTASSPRISEDAGAHRGRHQGKVDNLVGLKENDHRASDPGTGMGVYHHLRVDTQAKRRSDHRQPAQADLLRSAFGDVDMVGPGGTDPTSPTDPRSVPEDEDVGDERGSVGDDAAI
jgi:DNA-directed RNA polymerase subunit beta'